jgi:hypothetical protein
MRPIAAVIAVLGIVGVVAPSTANAGQAGNGSLTQAELVTFTENVGSALRFRQLGDTRTLGKGRAEVGVLFATEANDGWSGPRIAGRFGLSDRVDLGGWGGMNRDGDSGLVGADLRIALVSEGPNRPVSVSVRPSISSFVGTSEIWAAHAGVDLTVSKTFGRLSP